eukprot:gnl/TRDRNA2_/TRDRNA2_152542_c1_seq3.p1 gnl/TRDRNA2_/TRDRNA2_152542_c1~~gnl/TRDRNA2_/TRDRNA2_152542_c1_seq3.p1  ORF type:complete len:854 (+),score=199.68 gnl/TRDRNA2_/TRDRNA2_152542_c1_seq3:358-2562(+)
MFIVVQGTLDCFVAGAKVSELQQGSIIGEIAVLGLSNVRTATLRAQTVCLVQVLHRSIFMKYLSEFPREMIQFQEVGTQRLEKIPVHEYSNIYRKQMLFRDCSPEFLDRLSHVLHRKFFFVGQKIIKEGTDSNEMYAIQQGRLVVEKRGVGIGVFEDGHCFGELAVLGVAQAQTVTVRAETLCDMQILNRWDLEELLKEFPAERERLNRVIASTMREDLAEVTNVEILAEIPLLHDANEKLLDCLDSRTEVRLSRKDEVLACKSDSMMFVLLQGNAAVEVDGLAVRELSEGDSFGAIQVLGLPGCPQNVDVRATALCLWLCFDCATFSEAVQDLMVSPGTRHMTFAKSKLLQHLELEVGKEEELLEKCEEVVFMQDECILSPQERAHFMLFVLAGEVIVDTDLLGVGECVGELGSENRDSQSVFAATHCRVVMLHKKELRAFIDERPEEERAWLYGRLQTMPKEGGKVMVSNETLRERTDKLASQYIATAKMHLKANNKSISVIDGKKKSPKWQRTNSSAPNGFILPKGPRGSISAAAMIRNKGQPKELTASDVAAMLQPSSRSGSPHSDRMLPRYMTRSEKSIEEQEFLLCRDLQRLIAMARCTAQEAHADHQRLRHEADALRAQYAASQMALEVVKPTRNRTMTDGTSGTDTRDGSSGSSSGSSGDCSPRRIEKEPSKEKLAQPPPEVEAVGGKRVMLLRKENMAMQNKIRQLEAKLRQACGRQEELLEKLK